MLGVLAVMTSYWWPVVVVCRPFRKYDLKNGVKSWDKVASLEKGGIYQEVCEVVLYCSEKCGEL